MNEHVLRRAVVRTSLALAVTSCSPRAPSPAPTTTETAAAPDVPSGDDTSSTLGSNTTSAPTATSIETAAPRATVSAQPVYSIEKRFAPHELTCKVDADCAVTAFGVSERLFCCDSCDSVPGTKAWVGRADRHCEAYRKGTMHSCPPRDCEPPGNPACRAGTCVLVP